MNQLTIFEKIQVLFKLLFSSPIIIGIFVFSLFLMIILFFNSKLNKKFVKYVFIGIYLLVIGFAFVKYGSYFLTSIDSFLTLFMANIYFPTIPIYVAIMIISFIIMIVTLSSNKSSKVVKVINTVFFTLIQMLFAIFIYIIETNKIDVSQNSNLYTNEQTLTLLELGMGLFFIWIVVLLIMFYFKKADKIFKTKKVVEQDDFDEYINDYNEPTSNGDILNSSIISNNVDDSIVNENSVDDNNFVNAMENNSIDNNINFVDTFNNNIVNENVGEIENIEDNDLVNPIVDSDINVYSNVSDILPSDGLSDEVLSFEDSTGDNMQENNVVNAFEKISNDQLDNSFIINKPPVLESKPINKPINSSVDIFNSFNFLDVPNTKVERRTDDVEIIDFD